MKSIFTLFFLALLNNGAFSQRCGTVDYVISHPKNTNNLLRSQSPGTPTRDTLANEVIIIPVVVHVLYNTGEQNISDQQVLSQITVLNNDYRRQNADTVNTPVPFKSVAADSRIQFCLAKVDPQGFATSGIIHKYTKQSQFLADDQMKFTASGGDDAWDATRYLNIWVCNLFGRTLGYAVLPGSPAERDGVVIQYGCFGTTSNVAAPYNKGRTATHEIGHWLGLKHLWGDAFCGDDGIADTPPQETSNTYCPVFPHLSSCSVNPNGDMFMDFMDFTDDGCMNMFTQGQKAEMRGLFALGQPRNSFLNSTSCDGSNAIEAAPIPTTPEKAPLKITVYPNPFSSLIKIVSNDQKSITGKILRLYDVTGKLYHTETITSENTTLNINGLPAGIYILKIEGGSESFVYKLIKQP
ncbi:MAG TPA: M43 family zinc metalloprotease [Hanamia sp.]